MTIRVLLVPAHDAPSVRNIEPTLAEMTKLLGCRYIEGHTVDQNTFAYLDEEGRITCRPVNPAATIICRSCGTISNTDLIFGRMVLVGHAGPLDPNEHDVPDYQIDRIIGAWNQAMSELDAETFRRLSGN